jgi:hypothetical protein
MTAWARLAREDSEQSCGNDGAMESQHQAFHISLEISQKTRDSHIPTAPATGCFTGMKKDSKNKKKPKAVYTKVLTTPLLYDSGNQAGLKTPWCRNFDQA